MTVPKAKVERLYQGNREKLKGPEPSRAPLSCKVHEESTVICKTCSYEIVSSKIVLEPHCSCV